MYDWYLPFDVDAVRVAFLAGFILADGHIRSLGHIIIRIAKKDVHLLEWICHVFQWPYSTIQMNDCASISLPAALGRLFIKYFHLSPKKRNPLAARGGSKSS